MNAETNHAARPPAALKHCLLPMAALLLTALAALLPHSAPAGEPMRIRLIVDGKPFPPYWKTIPQAVIS